LRQLKRIKTEIKNWNNNALTESSNMKVQSSNERELNYIRCNELTG